MTMAKPEHVRRKLARIIHRHNDFCMMIKEVSCSLTGQVVLEQIEKQSADLDIEVSVVAKGVISGKVQQVAKCCSSGGDYERDLQGILSTISYLIKREILMATDLGEQLLSVPSFLGLPLTALWKFKALGVVSIEQIFKSIHEDMDESLPSIKDDLKKIILKRGPDSDAAIIVSETLGSLVSLSYTLNKEEYGSLSKSASDMLYSLSESILEFVLQENKEDNLNANGKPTGLTGKVKSHKKSGDEPSAEDSSEAYGCEVLNIYELLMNNLSVSLVALQSFCSAQLIHMLTFRPNLHVATVLKSHEKWRSTRANATLTLLMEKLVIVIGYESALQSLNTVITNEEVNWECVLTLAAIAINCHKHAVTLLKDIIEQHIRIGCIEQDIESLVIGFIFARHASLEGRHLFPSYSQWFSSLFAMETSSPAANKQSFVVLIQFLTDLVPHEPPYCLRTHLTNQIFVPKGCQDLLRDYYNLARARLLDLKDDFDSHVAPRQNAKDKNKVVEEVETCIEHYNQTGKIPNSVLEASIFRKPYYRSSFLPALLAPRTLPDKPDTLSKFIDALNSLGKIPSSMYKKYIEECHRVTSDLLSGVFVNVEEDVVVEEPITELTNILEELVDSSSILPVLSRVSHKIEEMMQILDLTIKNKKHLVLNSKLFSTKLLASQVVREFINTFERVSFNQTRDMSPSTKPDWVPQFLSILSSSVSLQDSFFNYLMYNLDSSQYHEQSQDQTNIHGALLSEISNIEGLFLPVVDSASMNDIPIPFSSFFFSKLEANLSTKLGCVYSCTFLNSWLSWHLKNDKSKDNISALTSLPQPLLCLYCFLAPRLALIQGEGEDELSIAHAYSLLRGHCIPSCSRLYFSLIKKSAYKYDWMTLEKWIGFELNVTWESTPVDVRLAYLQCRIQQDFLSLGTTDPSSNAGNTLGEIISKIIFAYLEFGMKTKNSCEILLLLQNLANQNLNADICLLEKWKSNMNKDVLENGKLLSYMNICRCLPPSYFLPPDRLFELSGVFEHLVTCLKTCDESLQLNFCDTSFLTTCLLNAAGHSSVKDLHIEKCLRHIRSAIIYYWESIESIFEENVQVVVRHKCLESLRLVMKNPVANLNCLSPDESGIALLSLCLKDPDVDGMSLSEFPENIRISYMKWLLAYIGLQQLKGLLPFFPSEKSFLDTMEKDKRVLENCGKVLRQSVIIPDLLKLIKNIFPGNGEKLLPLKMVPTACVLVALQELASSKDESVKDPAEFKLFELLLHCHIYIGEVFDSSESTTTNVSQFSAKLGKSEPGLHLCKETSYPKDIEYVSDLYQRMFCILSKVSPKLLCRIPKSTISKCDEELQASLKFRLQCRER